MRYLLTYDISDDRIRNTVSKYLLKYGVRVQLSCFEIECSEEELKKILSFIDGKIDKTFDSVFVFPISKNMESSIVEIGVKRNLNPGVI